jgi:hypothetical protein
VTEPHDEMYTAIGHLRRNPVVAQRLLDLPDLDEFTAQARRYFAEENAATGEDLFDLTAISWERLHSRLQVFVLIDRQFPTQPPERP